MKEMAQVVGRFTEVPTIGLKGFHTRNKDSFFFGGGPPWPRRANFGFANRLAD